MNAPMRFEVSKGPRAVVTRSANFTPRPSIYPFEHLEAPEEVNGETIFSQFFVPGKTTKNFGGIAAAASKRLAKRGTNASFAVRAARDVNPASGEEEDGVLIQRVEYRAPKPMTPEQKAARAAARAAKKAGK